MLTRSDRLRLRERGTCSLHDYWFTSLASGEPYFEKGVLAYYDGRIVTLCGFPLRGEQPLENGALVGAVRRWVEARGVEAVRYFGPCPPDLHYLKDAGFRRTIQDYRTPLTAELVIDCTDGPHSVFGSRLYRRARSKEFRAVIKSGGRTAPAEYYKLIEKFYQLRQVSSYLANTAFVLPILIRSRNVNIIEARRGDRLHGFILLHKAFVDGLMSLYIFHDHATAGVSDFLYGEMLNYARSLGAASVNVGASPSPGHYDFKVKWGGKPEVPPYHLVHWARGHLARRYHTSWGPRIIRL